MGAVAYSNRALGRTHMQNNLANIYDITRTEARRYSTDTPDIRQGLDPRQAFTTVNMDDCSVTCWFDNMGMPLQDYLTDDGRLEFAQSRWLMEKFAEGIRDCVNHGYGLGDFEPCRVL